MGLIRKIMAWALILFSLLFLVMGIDFIIDPKYGWSTGVITIIIFFIPLFVVGWKLRKEPKKVERVLYQQQAVAPVPPPKTQTIPPSPQPTTLPPPPSKTNSYLEEIDKYQKAISVLENQRTIGEISAESYSMAKTNLERELQKLLQYKEEVDKTKKSVIEGIQSRGSIGKADLIKDFNIQSEIANETLEQLIKDNIIEKTETGERYRLKGKTKKCPFCRRTIPADLAVCPICGSIIE